MRVFPVAVHRRRNKGFADGIAAAIHRSKAGGGQRTRPADLKPVLWTLPDADGGDPVHFDPVGQPDYRRFPVRIEPGCGPGGRVNLKSVGGNVIGRRAGFLQQGDVGVHCRQYVPGGRAAVRAPVAAAGHVPGDNPDHNTPPGRVRLRLPAFRHRDGGGVRHLRPFDGAGAHQEGGDDGQQGDGAGDPEEAVPQVQLGHFQHLAPLVGG